jgi:hypothetical protein
MERNGWCVLLATGQTSAAARLAASRRKTSTFDANDVPLAAQQARWLGNQPPVRGGSGT